MKPTTLEDYKHHDDDHLITEEEAIQLIRGEWRVTRKQAKRILKAETERGNLEWVLAN